MHRAQPSHALLRSAGRLRLQRADGALRSAARVRPQVVHAHLSAAEDRAEGQMRGRREARDQNGLERCTDQADKQTIGQG